MTLIHGCLDRHFVPNEVCALSITALGGAITTLIMTIVPYSVNIIMFI